MLQEKNSIEPDEMSQDTIKALAKAANRAMPQSRWMTMLDGKEEDIPIWYFDDNTSLFHRVRRWWYDFRVKHKSNKMTIQRVLIPSSLRLHGREKLKECFMVLKKLGWMNER